MSEVARKHAATRWQIYDWLRRFRPLRMLPPCEASPPVPDRPKLSVVAKNDRFQKLQVFFQGAEATALLASDFAKS
ncbi:MULTISPECIES: hypothetical protein [unclassified Bradyrhizobium]|uniref:hypothetical protein n=1 Tax=unclassified Bradyrhizobium TaxID=2631580 RepID=UPI00209EA8A0|nr:MULTISPECIES: hypothetical protein [unclassified Bradyrhizobium]